jgi:hypothetical protein
MQPIQWPRAELPVWLVVVLGEWRVEPGAPPARPEAVPGVPAAERPAVEELAERPAVEELAERPAVEELAERPAVEEPAAAERVAVARVAVARAARVRWATAVTQVQPKRSASSSPQTTIIP